MPCGIVLLHFMLPRFYRQIPVFFNCSLLSYTFSDTMAIGQMHFFAKFIFFSMTKIRRHADKQACAANTQTCLKG
ncbi:hypothetical protein DXC51_23790 [Eisenbergiella massiliensis]|uniref:Uncharacterized protein n=1 Tax=Eisenbergiella massiliensis TaxID=1720294 RepID=A0A3E3HXR3_9FIRM|nr:hypothetical protein DXC51_23790 [Eisenbergiella massiliensis]